MVKVSLYGLFLSLVLLACNQQSLNIDQLPEADVIDKKYPEAAYFESRNWPDQVFGKKSFLQAAKVARNDINITRSVGSWETQGPGNISGRVGTIEIDDSGNIYLGYSKGGIFKSSDDGATFRPILDDQAFLAVSDIEIDPNNEDIVYVGTGDVDISIMFGIGNGVLKSLDGGNTWENIGLEEASIISRVHVDAGNSDIVYACAMGVPGLKNNDRGVYKSLDAGANWEQVLFVNDSTGIQDMIVHPTNPDIVYATGWNRFRSNRRSVVQGPDARIYRTKDGGTTWDTLSNGLPEGDFARVGLAMSGTNPDILFVNYGTTQNFHSMYKSFDGGDSWVQIAERGENGIGSNTHGGFAWFFGQMRVNPLNDDDIFLLGVQLLRTLDGGQNWDNVLDGIHVDNHDLVFDGDRIYVGNDGGAYRAENLSTQWVDLDFNPTGLLYKVGYNPHEPDLYYGGAQDNSMYYGNKEMINNWVEYGFGDGFQPAFHATNPDIFFFEAQNGLIIMEHPEGSVSLTNGMDGSFYWDTPYILSSHDPNMVFTGSDRIYAVQIDEVSGDIQQIQLSDVLPELGSDWLRHNISTLHQSPVDANVLYAGTTDGLIWRTQDFGTNWENVNDGIPRRFVSKVYASPTDAQKVYACLTGYRDADYIPHVFRSDDQGTTWVDISGNLPQFAVNDVFVYPDNNDEIIFVATDGGVYFTTDAGLVWERLGDDMPIIPVWDLDWNEVKNEIIAGTFARSIMSFDLAQVNIGPGVSTTDQDVAGLKIYPSASSSTVTVDFDLNGPLTLNIIDANGRQLQSMNVSKTDIIDISSYPSGSLFFEVVGKDSRSVHQVIKI